jgi:hypothetical protein
MSRQDTIAWVAARKFLGDVWNTSSFNVKKAVDDMELDDEDETKDKMTSQRMTKTRLLLTQRL